MEVLFVLCNAESTTELSIFVAVVITLTDESVHCGGERVSIITLMVRFNFCFAEYFREYSRFLNVRSMELPTCAKAMQKNVC